MSAQLRDRYPECLVRVQMTLTLAYDRRQKDTSRLALSSSGILVTLRRRREMPLLVTVQFE
jgi:hypothetical protein